MGSVSLFQSGGGGSATPGGSNGDIQYNNNGALGGVTLVPATNNGVANIQTTSTGYIYSQWPNYYGGGPEAWANGSANTVWASMYTIPITLLVNKITVQIATTAASSSVFAGLYDVNKNKVVSAVFDSSTGGVKTATPVEGATTIYPGVYWWAWGSTSTTPTCGMGVQGQDLGSGNFGNLFNNRLVRSGTAANAFSAGAMPSTLGTITAAAGSAYQPLFLLET